MILRLYATLIFCWDVLIILVQFFLTLLQSLFHQIRAPKAKCLTGEVAAVSNEKPIKVWSSHLIRLCVSLSGCR